MDPDSDGPAESSCHLCGREAATVIDGIAWCASCLHARGSCCAEPGMEDD